MNETTPDIDCCLVTRTFVLGPINAIMQKTSIFTSMDLFQKPLGWLQDTAESLNHGIAATTGTGNKEGKPGRSFWNGETKSWEVAQYRD